MMTLLAGMDSFDEPALQTETGVPPEQVELDRQRTALDVSVHGLVG